MHSNAMKKLTINQGDWYG